MLGGNRENTCAQSSSNPETLVALAELTTKMDPNSGERPVIRTTLRSKRHSKNRAPLSDISTTIGNICLTDDDNLHSSRPRTIIIEGNIGCGKSTLLKYFGQKDNIEVFPEPVHKWRDNRGENMLELFYQDPSRWSFAFESYNQFTLLQEHQTQPNCRIKLMERSIYSGKYCFIESLYESGKLQTPEYNILTEWFEWLIKKDVLVDHIVYLRSTPEQCEQRIIERSRKEEAGIPLDYLRDLHERHEDWLIRKKFELPAPVLILDATKPLDEMMQQFKDLEQKLEFDKL
ncbi:deoxynucleoside kinase-like [Acanthaster planci]|uniref:Deoxynucleoside kinase-like n=1 Tax=Acanthaster planci TaxID=133434 RepID=A0A8B7YMR7_ACAPL|nr:deoxynucleoside kinase-like [Acanthaster planci]